MNTFIEIAVPPNTLEGAPVLTTVQLEQGVIDQVDVDFPPGCCRLAHLAIYCHSIQIIPWNKTGSLVGNGSVFHEAISLMLDQAPFELLLLAWNLDDTYQHTIRVDIKVTPAKQRSAGELLLELE